MNKPLFSKKVNLKSRKGMLQFLKSHFRYYTASSWNRSMSYAHNIKLYNLRLPKEVEDKAWALLEAEGMYDSLNAIMSEFDKSCDYEYQAGFNGRSGGYIVMYKGFKEKSTYKSFCPSCSVKTWYEPGVECQRCHEDVLEPIPEGSFLVRSYPGKDVDFYDEEATDEELRANVEIVQRFDKMVDEVREEFIRLCTENSVEEEVVYLPKKVKVLRARA